MSEGSDDGIKRNEIYSYDSKWPVYALSWSVRNDPKHKLRLAVGSFVEEYDNYVQIIQHDEERDQYVEREKFMHSYPPTKLMWIPDKNVTSPDILASSGDCLHIWEFNDQGKVTSKATLDNGSEYCSPITSFDWNEMDLNTIGTSSIDTTCTIWDVETQKIKTQLIAHDTEVNDIAFSNQKFLFTSVGQDGSVRVFDLRNLEHSTVLYDGDKPILRVIWNKHEPCYLAILTMDSSKTILLDVRMPTHTVVELVGHTGPVNSMSFAPHSPCHICTAGDDSRALIWNLSRTTHPMVVDPILSYNAGYPINTLQWSVSHPDWIGIAFNRTVQILRV